MTGRVRPSGSGAGFRSLSGELLDAVAGLPVDEVLLRVEWARLVPREGALDEEELDWIGTQLVALRAEGKRTGLVLTDGAVPSWMGPEAWLMPAMPGRLVDLALGLVGALGGMADVILPVEEPGAWCAAGWVVGSAPPLRRGALRDAMVAVDAMVAAHLRTAAALASTAPDVEVTWLASTGVAQVAERAVLGLPVGTSATGRAIAALASRGPGLAAGLRAEGLVQGVSPILPFGDRPPSPTGPLEAGCWAAGRALSPPATTVSEAQEAFGPGPAGLRLLHTCATIDERGRVSGLRGHHRVAQIEGALAEMSSRAPAGRLVVGEACDRWRWGSYRAREGLFGVDRTRGARGYELLPTDSAGIDVASALAGILAG